MAIQATQTWNFTGCCGRIEMKFSRSRSASSSRQMNQRPCRSFHKASNDDSSVAITLPVQYKPDRNRVRRSAPITKRSMRFCLLEHGTRFRAHARTFPTRFQCLIRRCAVVTLQPNCFASRRRPRKPLAANAAFACSSAGAVAKIKKSCEKRKTIGISIGRYFIVPSKSQSAYR